MEIPDGNYEDVTLIVDAPKATVRNAATFKQILVQAVAKDTWCECVGNKLYFSEKATHLIVEQNANPSLTILGGSDSVTVENNGNLKEILISKAAQVLVKGDSIAQRITVDNIAGGKITTYLPLDIYSTTTFDLVVGENGEQTAVIVSGESDVPAVSGLGTISITIDSRKETKNIVAENDGSLENLATTVVSGRVISEDEKEVKATVYLAYYTMDMTEDNVSVYLSKSKTKETQTGSDGIYQFEDVTLGNYVLIVEAEGYQLLMQNIYIDANFKDRNFEVEDILLADEDGQEGNVKGFLVDVETGDSISRNLTITLRKGMNNITSNALATTNPDSSGEFEFRNLSLGQYTIAVRDEREKQVYGFAYENISVMSGTTVNKTIYMSKFIASDEVRFVLTWGDEASGASEDLDIYVYGPNAFKDSEYGIHYGDYTTGGSGHRIEDGEYTYLANLDVDDKTYEGLETVTVTSLLSGRYKVFVRDYSNLGSGNNLYKSAPVIRIYAGTTLKDTIRMGATKGGTWYVGDYVTETGRFVLVDEAGNESPNKSVKAQIGTVLNRLEQFTVTDARAFAPYQSEINEIKEKYLAAADDDKLSDYLARIRKVEEDIKDALTIESISGKGFTYSYGQYQGDHSLYTIYGSSEAVEDFSAVMKAENTTCVMEELSGRSFDYQLTVTPVSGVEVTSIEYREDAEDVEKWDKKYDEIDVGNADVVLHLKRQENGTTLDYVLHYVPLGAELLRIDDKNNSFISQHTGYNSWTSNNNSLDYTVEGINEELGTTWIPAVTEGAEYTVEPLSDEDKENGYSYAAEVTVTRDNGAVKKYHIYHLTARCKFSAGRFSGGICPW